MDQCTKEVRMAYWKEIIARCQGRPENQSAKQWLRENNIREQTYYAWQRIIRQQAYEQLQNLPRYSTPEGVQSSIAYQALLQLGAIYKLDEKLKKLSPEKRLKERETSVRPLVEASIPFVVPRPVPLFTALQKLPGQMA